MFRVDRRQWLFAAGAGSVAAEPARAWVSAQQLTEPHNLPPAPGLAGVALRQIAQPAIAQGEADRQSINQWMRRSGELDGVIDVDAVGRDPSAPTRLAAALASGDHLHPSAAGYRIMADAIDLHLFT